jgi:hypothetical protein
VNDITNFLKQVLFVSLFVGIWQRLKPPQPFSWQTLIFLSLFSWLMSVLAVLEYVKDALSAMGWLFLTFGVGWALSGWKFNILGVTFYPGPWITGALLCVFLVEGWSDLPNSTAYILWPTLSALIASLPKFVKPGPVPTTPDVAGQQQIVLLVLSNMIISCWFGFHFLLRDWLREYPSIQTSDFSRSAFVVRLGSPSRDQSRGVPILQAAGDRLTQALEGRVWSETERWLLNINQEIAAIEAEVRNNLAPVEENALWSLRGQVPPTRTLGYTVVLQALWQGPSSDPNGYYLEKTCLLTQAPRAPGSTNASPQALTQVRCGPVSSPYPNAPAPGAPQTRSA